MAGRRPWGCVENSYLACPLLDDLLLETLDERGHLALLGLGHLQLRQGRAGVTEEDVPVTFADAHAAVAEQHVPAAVVHRSARARAEEVDQELLLALDAVFAAMRPEAAELRIRPEPGQQVICKGRDRVVATKAFVKGPLLVAHRRLLEPEVARDGVSRKPPGGIEGQEGASGRAIVQVVGCANLRPNSAAASKESSGRKRTGDSGIGATFQERSRVLEGGPAASVRAVGCSPRPAAGVRHGAVAPP